MLNWCRRLRPILATALLVSAGAAHGQDVPDSLTKRLKIESTEDLVIHGDATPSARNLRVPSAGGNSVCQQNGNFINPVEGSNLIGFGVTASSTSTTATVVLDNFRVAGTGPKVLNRVTWAAWFETGASPSIVRVVPTNQNFIIAIYDHVNGAPASPALATVTVPAASIAITENAADQINRGNPAGTFGVNEFSAVLPSDITLTGGNCYWIEIRPEPASFNTQNRYFVRPSLGGDGVMIRRTINGATTAPSIRGLSLGGGDTAFCVGAVLPSGDTRSPVTTVSVADGLQCPIGTHLACGTPSFASCQTWDGTGLGFTSSGNITVADNFTISTASSINSICWLGFYGAAEPAATAEQFTIRIMRDVGGAVNGVPDITNVVATIVADTGGTNAPLVRNTQSATIFGTLRSYSVTLPVAVDLTPGCYWLEIRNTNTTVVQWLWMTKANSRTQTLADTFNQQRPTAATPYSQSTQVFNADAVWCLSGTQLVRSTTCLAIQPAVNRTCATATNLAIGGATLFSNTLVETDPASILPPAVGGVTPTRNGAWYRLAGNGNTITVSTCNSGADPRAASTNFDTTISVYCSKGTAPNECAGPFIGIASNDDATPACGINADASSVSFPTVAGQNYFIYVSGTVLPNFTQNRGYFYINATNGAAATATPCANLFACSINRPPAASTTSENEDCGEFSPNEECDTAEVLALGNWGFGTMFTDGTDPDQDVWQLPTPIDTAGGGQWYDVQIRSELPVRFIVFPNACAGGSLGLGTSIALQACTAGEVAFRIWVPVNADPGLFVIIRNLTLSGPGCDSVGRGNRYAFRFTLAATGACCAAGSQCTTTVSGNDIVDFFTGAPSSCEDVTGGVYQGDGTACDTNNPPAPCNVDGSSPGVVGTCCGTDGTCFPGTQGNCVAGTTFAAATTCTAAGCPDTSTTCCLGTGACLLLPSASCVSAGGISGTATSCVPNACPQPALGGCCDVIGACFLTFSFDCPTGAGVTFNPAITSCSPNNCPPRGACCNALVCSLVVQSICAGTWQGPNTTCTPNNPCDPSGACCNGTSCTITTQSTCTGTWQGPTTTCAPTDPCAPATVVCCRGSTCSIVASAACTTTGFSAGFSTLTGSTCNASGNNTSPCCHANYNKIDGVTVPDIFAFLGDWFANSPFAFVGGDGTGVGSPGVPAIFAFLGAWFAGCP